MIDLKIIGKNCKMYRISNGWTLADVAKETQYSCENISAFEHGRINNGFIMLWYLHKGMDLIDLFQGTEFEKEVM